MGRSWIIVLLHIVFLAPDIIGARSFVHVQKYRPAQSKFLTHIKRANSPNISSIHIYRNSPIFRFETDKLIELGPFKNARCAMILQPFILTDTIFRRISNLAHAPKNEEYRIQTAPQEQVNQQQTGKTTGAKQQTKQKPAEQKAQTSTPLVPAGKTFKPGYNKPTYTTPKKKTTSTTTPKKSSKVNPGTRQNFNRTYTPKRVTPAKAIKTVKSTTTKQSTGTGTGSTNK